MKVVGDRVWGDQIISGVDEGGGRPGVGWSDHFRCGGGGAEFQCADTESSLNFELVSYKQLNLHNYSLYN